MKCVICNSELSCLLKEGRDYLILDGNSDNFKIVFCDKCQIGYSLPILNDSELNKYYPASYIPYNVKKGLYGFLQNLKYKSDLIKCLNAKVLQCQKFKSQKIFEIGAGCGEFLNYAKKQGFNVFGIEPDKACIDFAEKQYNINLEHGYIKDYIFSNKYNIIVMRHVLEHLNDFKECLENIFSNGLADNGLLFLKLPCLDSWEAKFFKKFWSGFDLPRHRTHFTKHGIYKLLKDIGFVNIKVKGEIVPIDIIRSIGYYSRHGNIKILKKCALFFSCMPMVFKMVIVQLIAVCLMFFGAGRMIVFANR